MLELKDIKKDYPAGDSTVHALKGVSLQFRRNEFVAILGQSGCGKTTLLNIIGGLDHYTTGDLRIHGRSTKDYKDRDWDTYRNHSIGFVFQSYNLIPHQSVLQNVELALTLSGVSKSERRARAKAALVQVGLGNQLRKRPSQMSGGQMQRVAIARALVNNPDIILADEPTGALDTETSVQVMEILKEIAKDKLIIMVTHNPELAEKYATRTIRMRDGEILSDSMPMTDEEYIEEKKIESAARRAAKAKKRKREKKPSMSVFTGFSLSLKNLLAKGGRTALTSFAGSIGIIGIALIFSVSNGLTTYIDMVQESTLSSYPLTIESTNIDVSTLITTFMGVGVSEDREYEEGKIYEQTIMYDMVEALNSIETTENDLMAFKEFIEQELAKEDSPLAGALSGIQYTYALNLLVYTKNVDGNIIKSDTEELLQKMMMESMGMDLSAMGSSSSMMGSSMSGSMMSMGTSSATLWQEMLPGDDGAAINDIVLDQYDLIYGDWPNNYNEIIVVVNQNNEIADMTLYALGLKPESEMQAIMDSAIKGTPLEESENVWTFEELCDMNFRVILNADCYTYDAASDTYTDLRDTDTGMKYLYEEKGMDLKVTGIVRLKEDVDAGMLSGTLCYLSSLTEHVIEVAKDKDTIQAQLDNPFIDIFTGLPFEENTGTLSAEEKESYFRDYIAQMSDAKKAETYIAIKSIPDATFLKDTVAAQMANFDREKIETMLAPGIAQEVGMAEEEIAEYLANLSDEDIFAMMEAILTQQVKAQYAAQTQAQMAGMPQEQLVAGLTMELETYTTEACATYYDEVVEFSKASYEGNLEKLGYLDLDNPKSINFYASTFENKDIIEEVIADYNKTVDEIKQITYTDYVGLMMSSITTIINAITYVLIAFVAISLIVSSIMIAVITLISVQERTKEIGILRAMGASKRNVSVMFNAETVLIGFASGAIGVGVTYLLCLPINAIIFYLTEIKNLKAYLPWQIAVVLILISVILTLISGLIPATSAAKKDPVVALRTE